MKTLHKQLLILAGIGAAGYGVYYLTSKEAKAGALAVSSEKKSLSVPVPTVSKRQSFGLPRAGVQAGLEEVLAESADAWGSLGFTAYPSYTVTVRGYRNQRQATTGDAIAVQARLKTALGERASQYTFSEPRKAVTKTGTVFEFDITTAV